MIVTLAANHVRYAAKRLPREASKQRSRDPDDGHPQNRRAQADAAQASGVLPRSLGHALAHRLGESGKKQTLDRENEADRRAEIAHVNSPRARPPAPRRPAQEASAASAW